MKILFTFLAAVAISISTCSFSFCQEPLVLDIPKQQAAEAKKSIDSEIITVTLKGKIHHFGTADFYKIVPDVNVWIAEFPESKGMGIKSDKSGFWTMRIRKFKGYDIAASFIYEKKDWATTKSNVITIAGKDITDLVIQFIDPDYFFDKMKPQIETMLSLILPAGSETKLKNAMVATVGKSWASMNLNKFPHGDPGATVNAIPGALGPIYFNENVQPDPDYKAISNDGGVAWLNVPPGAYTVTANKKNVKYSEVKFVVGPNDAEKGIMLYVASPPYSIQGSNDSAPGKD